MASPELENSRRIDELRIKVFCLVLDRPPLRRQMDPSWQQGVAFLMGNIDEPPPEFREGLRTWPGFSEADKRFLTGRALRREDGMTEPISNLLHSIFACLREARSYNEPLEKFLARLYAEEQRPARAQEVQT